MCGNALILITRRDAVKQSSVIQFIRVNGLGEGVEYFQLASGRTLSPNDGPFQVNHIRCASLVSPRALLLLLAISEKKFDIT